MPGWSDENENPYKQLLEHWDREIADDFLHSLNAVRRAYWAEAVKVIDLTTSIGKVSS